MDQQVTNTQYNRDISLRGATIDAATRTVEFSVSSEEPVERWFGTEVLVHEAAAIDLSRFKSGFSPLLLDHDTRNQIGVIERVWLDTAEKKLRAKVRFGKGAKADEVFQDVVDGIRGNVSIGYLIENTEKNEKTGVVRATRWLPYEASMVSVPADMTVGVRRSNEASETVENETTPDQRKLKMPDDVIEETRAAPVVAPAQVREAPAVVNAAEQAAVLQRSVNEAVAAAVRDANEILTLAAKYNVRDKGEAHIKAGGSLAAFRGVILDGLAEGQVLSKPEIGLTGKEARQFSIFRLLTATGPNASREDRNAGAFEREAIDAASVAFAAEGVETRGMRMPSEVMDTWGMGGTMMNARRENGQRAISVAGAPGLVGTDHHPEMFIDVLRNGLSVTRAGARMMTGMVGLIDIPKKSSGSVAAWGAAEASNATNSEAAYTSLTMSPKDLSTYSDITRRMRQQGSPDAEALTRADITMAIILGIDKGAIEGSGASGQPRGVRNVVGVGKPTAFVALGSPTFAEVVLMETTVANVNALDGNLSYIGTTNMRGTLKSKVLDAGSGRFIIEGDKLNGYDYIPTNQLTANTLYFGNWADVIIGMWGSLDLVPDYAALALSGGLRLFAWQTVDVLTRRAESFCYNL